MNMSDHDSNPNTEKQPRGRGTLIETAIEAAERAAEADDHHEIVKTQLKVLLLHLAARSSSPSADLEDLLHEVIEEIHTEVKQALDQRSQFRLVLGGAE